MTAESTTIRSARPGRSSETNGSARQDARGHFEGTRSALGAAASQVADAVETTRTVIPEVARSSRAAMTDAMSRIEAGSDQQVAAGATLSLGLAIGMLIGGAPRLLVVLALLPLTAMAAVLLDRLGPGGTSR